MYQTKRASIEKIGNKWILISGEEQKEFKTKREAETYYFNLPITDNIELLLDETDKKILSSLSIFNNKQKQIALKRYSSDLKIISEVERKVNEYMIKVIKEYL